MIKDVAYYKVSQLALFCLGISITLLGCGVEVHDITAPDASSCKFTGKTDGLKVSAEPFIEKDKLIRYFGSDLRSKGLIPILIIFENKNAGDGFIIVQERAKLTIEKSGHESERDARASYNRYSTEPPLTYSISPVTDFTVPILFGIVGGVIIEQHYVNLAIIARNMEEKKLVDKIVYPSSSHYGFVYFRIEKEDDMVSIKEISFDIKNIRTNEMITLTAIKK